MIISIIAAIAGNGVIGDRGSLPWHLPADLAHFKQITMGHPLIMGRKTFESVGRPLPGRTIVVVTRQENYSRSGVVVVHSLVEALKKVGDEEEVFLAGGAEIYRSGLEIADLLYLTLIHQEFPGDTFFPERNEAEWELTSKEDFAPDEKNSCAYSFEVFSRRRPLGDALSSSQTVIQEEAYV